MDDRPREKRIIMIKICVDGNQVKAKQVGHNEKMLNEDRRYFKELHDNEHTAQANKEKRRNKETLQVGDRVHADSYTEEPEYDHAGVHLYDLAQDEIVWYSEEPINFIVDIHRDPELVLLAEPTPFDRPVEVGKNVGIDNPFGKNFPLESRHGEAVSSGPISGAPAVMAQRYYKYSVTVTGIKNPLDPHVEGHRGF